MLKMLQRPLALLALAGLAACSGGGGASVPPAPPPAPPTGPTTGGSYSNVIVGIGDSLTAGTQSGTTMGAPSLNANSPLPGNLVPPTQENGYFALLFAQANSITLNPGQYNLGTSLATGGVSPLPLINAPGLGGQILANPTTGIFTTHSNCDAFDAAGFTLSSAMNTVRVNPLTKTYDLAVPGITMHEALTMTAPLTGAPPGPLPNGSCPGYPNIANDPTAGGLQSLVESESENFYPVLGSYAAVVQPLTELNVALSLKPSVATVWLGANDLLKYTFSAGASPATDPPAQFQADLTTIVTSLEKSGTKVVVADLPNVLQTPQFFQGGVPANPAAPSQTVYFYLQIFSKGAISASNAATFAGALKTQCGVGSGGYLTETGMLTLLSIIEAGGDNPASATCPLDINGTPGLGEYYLTDAFAAQVQALNTGYNTIIDGVAAGTGATLVPITATFDAIYAASNNGASATPYYYLIPGTADVVSLRFGGKLVGFDGLHPSDTGYALVANAFIQAAQAGGITIAGGPLSAATINTIYQADPYYLPSPFVPGAPMSRTRAGHPI
jgi:lysophospholipase L1-like esterase